MTQNNIFYGDYKKNKYMIAGVKTGMIIHSGGIVDRQSEGYLCDFEGYPEIIVAPDCDDMESRFKELAHLTQPECEYMWTGAAFCEKLLDFDGFMLHASAVAYEGKAYLFSAPSGTGKSTHTGLWVKHFGEDKAYIINDDKPVIRIVDGTVLVYGTPWSGKTNKNKNVGVPLQGICFLEQAAENSIDRMNVNDAVFRILNQTIRPKNQKRMASLLDILDRVLKFKPVYLMGCNMSEDAVMTAYNKMKG